MKTIYQITSKLAVTTFLLLSTTSAFAAGGTVTFTQGSPTGIPTLSGYMLILLSVLLCVVAFRTAKQKKSNINKLFITLIGTGVLVTAGSGVKLVSDVQAGGYTISFTNSNTASYPISPNSIEDFDNQTMQDLNFTITADTSPIPSLCSFRLFVFGVTNVPPPFSINALTHSGVLPSGFALDVRCVDPTTPT